MKLAVLLLAVMAIIGLFVTLFRSVPKRYRDANDPSVRNEERWLGI